MYLRRKILMSMKIRSARPMRLGTMISRTRLILGSDWGWEESVDEVVSPDEREVDDVGPGREVVVSAMLLDSILLGSIPMPVAVIQYK
jgi:hypothetical protein